MPAAGPGTNVRLNVSDVVQTHIVCSMADQIGLVSWHWRVTEKTNNGATLGDVAEVLDTVFAGLIKPLLAVAAAYIGFRAQRILPTPISAHSGTRDSLGAGGVAGDALPKQTSGIITWYTDFGGRMFRGRSYIPFPAENDNDVNGLPVATYVTRLDAVRTARLSDRTIIDGTGSVVLAPQIFHRASGTGSFITSAVSRPVWATQRRRGSYGARNVSPI